MWFNQLHKEKAFLDFSVMYVEMKENNWPITSLTWLTLKAPTTFIIFDSGLYN